MYERQIVLEKSNIILIGMPAVGKSTVGVILAKILGYSFIDSDLLIQESRKMLLSEIIAEEGVDGFLAIENEVNRKIEARRSVIATGGSAVYGREAMEHFRAIGTVIYLKEEFATLQRRLFDIEGRGVVLREGQTLQSLFLERSLLYEKYADMIIEERSRGPEDTIREIRKKLALPE